jgi:serine/threonine-protein kinase RsbW
MLRINDGGLGEAHFDDRIVPVIAKPIVAGPTLYACLTMRSQINAISPLVDRLMSLIKISHCVPGDDQDVEIALREALANAVLHGNKEDSQKKVHIDCHVHPGKELFLVIKDEGSGFDPMKVPDPTKAENILSEKGRGILLMRMLMDSVQFDDGGREVRLQKGFKRKLGSSLLCSEGTFQF